MVSIKKWGMCKTMYKSLFGTSIALPRKYMNLTKILHYYYYYYYYYYYIRIVATWLKLLYKLQMD